MDADHVEGAHPVTLKSESSLKLDGRTLGRVEELAARNRQLELAHRSFKAELELARAVVAGKVPVLEAQVLIHSWRGRSGARR